MTQTHTLPYKQYCTQWSTWAWNRKADDEKGWL